MPITETQRERSRLLFVLAVAPFLVLVAWHWRYGPLAEFGDWAQYLLHADALLHGRSYGDIGYIFTSRNPYIGPPVQPPGLPIFLVPVVALAGGARHAVLYKLVMVGFSLAFLGAVWTYLRRDGNQWLAAGAVMIVGLWLETSFVTNVVQPDVGFCAFLWVIFALADERTPWTWPRVVFVTALGFAALAFRVAALPIVPALATYAFIHRRTLGFRPLVPFLVWGFCGLAGALMIPGAFTFGRLLPSNPSGLVHNVVEALRLYPLGVFDLFLYPFPWNRANDGYHLAVGAVAAIGAVGWLRREWSRLLTIFAVFYVGMLAVLPMQDGRYLMPLAPLALFFLARGLSIVATWIGGRVRWQALTDTAPRLAFGACLTISAVALATQLVGPKPDVLLDVPGVRALFGRLTDANRAAPARVAFVNPRVLTWETGIPAMGFFLASPDSTLAEFRARRITHVVVGTLDLDAIRSRSVAQAVAGRPEAFRRLFAEGVFTVYAFESSAAPRP